MATIACAVPLPVADDVVLLRRCGAGDLEPLGLLYRRHARALRFYAASLTRDPGRADDVVQQSFLRLLHQDPATLRHSVRAVLFTIARNLVRDDLRREAVARRRPPPIEAVEPGDPAVDAERLERLAGAMDRLPTDQREAVILKVYGEFTFAEMAELLGAPEGTVKTRYRDALGKLARLLGEV